MALEKGDVVSFVSSKRFPPLKVVEVNLPAKAALVQSVNTGRKFGMRFESMIVLERGK